MAIQDPTAEHWLPVVGYETCYEVSSLGRVRSKARMRVNGYPIRSMILATSLSAGYPSLVLYDPKGNRKWLRVHRLVAEAFIGPAPFDDADVNHRNLDQQDNRPENLEWVTRKQNLRHASRGGRWKGQRMRASGGKTPSKLIQSEVADIRRRGRSGELARCIAKDFGMSESAIQKILRGISWKNVA